MPRPKNPNAKEKPITAERPKSIVLSEKQAVFVDRVLEGTNGYDAAREAGYARPHSAAATVYKTDAVKKALAEAREELSSASQIKRADVIDGIMEAINLARLAADPATMIKGWTEVGKILGHYAPEVKKLEITDNQKRLQSKYEAMTDEDLLKIIEGTAERVEEDAE